MVSGGCYRPRWTARTISICICAVIGLGGCASRPVESSPTETEAPGPTAQSIVAATGSPVAQARLPGEPDAALTPGAVNPAVTQATIGSTICVAGWTATIRPPSSYTTGLKVAQIAQYQYADTNLADYEEDHLISLELGGAPADPANLWPEPNSVALSDGRPVGAPVKDQLENKLHDLVCAGQITLATAQADIATDWIGTWFELTGQAPPPGSPGSSAGSTLAPGSSTAAGLSVQITRLTTPVPRGHRATATAATLPGASCMILVVYKSGPSSASGLGATTSGSAGVASWTWTVGTRTTPGTWPVTVTCHLGDQVGSATGSLRVT